MCVIVSYGYSKVVVAQLKRQVITLKFFNIKPVIF